MAWATDTQILLDIERSIGALRMELKLHIQRDDDRHKEIMREVEGLKRRRPAVDWSGILKNGWTQIVLFLLLLAGNVQFLDAVKLAFRR